jgi:RHS repeat-associated protein
LLVNATNGTTSSCRHFYYDNSSGYSGTLPTGITLTNQYGRVVEAATDTCSSGTLITDEWFAYDKDGNKLNLWQLTPHSTQYYKSTATFFGNGAPATVDLASPSLYTMTYGIDGEGRFNTLTDTTANQDIVTGTTYFPAANPEVVSLTGTDNNAYTYDLNTNQMTTFVFTVGSSNLTGNLYWNANNTLGYLTVTDGFNSGGSETCYSNASGSVGAGYDDLGRLIEFDCGSGHWGQQFAYDQFDNLTKTVLSGRTGTTWNPTYNASNQCPSPCAYDSDGNMTADGNDVYGWNAFSKVAWTATSGTPTCGTSGRCATYDAFGRMVESSNNSTWQTYWYTQAGGVVMMNGTTVSYAHWPTTHGIAELLDTTNFGYMPKDWIGNTRIVSNVGNHTVAADQSYTPYGEIYNIFGANNSQYQVFAGTIAELAGSTTTPIMWDTPNRELSYTGRWLSPDPAGSGWNQYAYTTNPNSFRDPTGLCQGGGAASGETNNCPPAWMNSNCPQPGPGGCELFYGGGGAGCSDLDNTGQCVPVGLLGSGDAGASCPNNICNGYSNGQYFEFIAGAGGAQGYVTENNISQGLYEINGNFYTPQQWQAYIAQVYAPQIDSQYDRTSNDAYLVFGDHADVDPDDPNVIGGHANFALSCDDLTVCGPGRYDFGIHVEYDSDGNLVVHDDTVSPWVSPASFSFSSLFSGNFWEHGFVDLVWGTLCNCVFSQ